MSINNTCPQGFVRIKRDGAGKEWSRGSGLYLPVIIIIIININWNIFRRAQDVQNHVIKEQKKNGKLKKLGKTSNRWSIYYAMEYYSPISNLNIYATTEMTLTVIFDLYKRYVFGHHLLAQSCQNHWNFL